MSSLSTTGILTSNNMRMRSPSLSQSPRKKAKRDQQTSYFKEVLAKAGLTLKYDETPNIITQEQSLVARDINRTIQSHLTYPRNAEEFVAGLKVWCRNETFMNKALLPTELQKPEFLASDSQAKIPQESLIRILLKVACLQEQVVQMLLQQISECVSEGFSTQLRLLLKQLCFLHYIKDSEALSTELVNIVETAPYVAQLEILNLIPEIIPDKEHEETAKQLTKLLEENAELTGGIIDCLSSLSTNISASVRSDMQQQILSRLEWPSSAKFFPILFDYLVTDCSAQNLQVVLKEARSALDTIMSSDKNDKETKSNKALIFNRLQSLVRGRKSLYEGWLGVISSVHSNTDEKAIDLLILFMLHSTGDIHKSSVEILFKKRVKTGMFKVTHIERLLTRYFVPQILYDYLDSIIKIAMSVLKCHNEPMLIEYASAMLKLLFRHELINCTQRQDIVCSLILMKADRSKKSMTPMLNILNSFLDDYEKLQQHVLQLMGLLEDLVALELKDVRLIFELLSKLTCGETADDSMSGFKDEIHMIIRKLLSSSKQSIKHRGIVAAVVTAWTLATTSKEQSRSEDSEDNSMTLEDLPQGRPQDAANLLMLANTCTLGKPESNGLYYDQLASMLTTDCEVDHQFLSWLHRKVTADFQEIFVAESVPEPINDLQLSMQFALNATEEMEVPIAINIGELSLKSQYFGNSTIFTLAPLFRLMRMIHFKTNNGNLTTIDALLGCAVVMPDLRDLDSYNSEQLKQVADCVFHCINWFRESISAFVTQKQSKLRNTVLTRLAGVVELEQVLEKCMCNIHDHKLPPSYFDGISQSTKHVSPSKSSKPPKKKPKTSETIINADDTIASTSAAVTTQQTKATTTASKKKPKESVMDRNMFREMDTDIIKLLRYPLKDSTSVTSQRTTLDFNQFKFLMADFVTKLEVLSSKHKSGGLLHACVINPNDLISDCAQLLPHIKKQLNIIVVSLEQLLQETDCCLDAEQIFTAEVNEHKTCFSLIVKSYALIFRWPGFQDAKNLDLLKNCLKALCTESQSQSQFVSAKGLILQLIDKLLGFVHVCLFLAAAVSLVEIVQALYVVNSDVRVKKRLALMSEKLLSKRWYSANGDVELGKSADIDVLVIGYLSSANVKTVYGLVGTLQGQAADLKSKDDCLPMLIAINKMNFHIFYRRLCMALLEAVRLEITALTNNQHLVLWRTTALTMQGLMSVVKAQESRANLTSFLKNCIGILKVFLSSGIPILEIMLRSKPDEVIEIFKIMQTSTRFLHHLCCYSKYTKDISLVPHVPHFRLLLESLLYRVKAALVANGCSDAFWMGILKNRDLQGEDIASQSSRSDESTTAAGSDIDDRLPEESEVEDAVDEDENGDNDDEDARLSDAY